MMVYPYKPFQGELETLQGPELAVLKDVSEGWYVDYREAPPSLKDLAKHMSAFANQYGGWLFLGVKEKDAKGMTAGSFPGIPQDSVPSVLVALREASSAHVSPPLFFETKVINGPMPELDLAGNRAIVVVGIPEGTDPPYIHSSGRIYRRVGDHSDPKPETDRHVLDLLWDRSARTRKLLEDFLTARPNVSKAESEMVRAYVYFLSDPNFIGQELPLAYSDFVDVMQPASGQGLFTVPLPNTFTTADGFVARQVGDSDPRFELLTFRWWSNGNVRVSVPVSVHDFIESESRLDVLQLQFLQALKRHGYRGGRVAEFSIFMAVLVGLTQKYITLRKLLGITQPFFGKIRLCHAWRVIPFVNLASYLKAIEIHGFPVVQDDEILCPPGLSSHSLVVMDEAKFEDKAKALLTVLPLAVAALEAVGISVGGFLAGGGDDFISELSDAVQDSLKAKSIR